MYHHTPSLHDALPISTRRVAICHSALRHTRPQDYSPRAQRRSEDRQRATPTERPPAAAQPIHNVQEQKPPPPALYDPRRTRSEEHTSELQSLMSISYAVFYLKKK